MKVLKLSILIVTISILSTTAYSKDCSDIKGNIVGKLFCKASDGVSLPKLKTSSSSTAENETEEKEGFKFFKKPKWMK